MGVLLLICSGVSPALVRFALSISLEAGAEDRTPLGHSVNICSSEDVNLADTPNLDCTVTHESNVSECLYISVRKHGGGALRINAKEEIWPLPPWRTIHKQ